MGNHLQLLPPVFPETSGSLVRKQNSVELSITRLTPTTEEDNEGQKYEPPTSVSTG